MPKFIVEKQVLVNRIYEVEASDVVAASAATMDAEHSSETEIKSTISSVVLASSYVAPRAMTPKARPKKTPLKRPTAIPDDFVPDIAWAMSKGVPKRKADMEAEKFKNYWQANRGATRGHKSDWPATWRNWILRVVEQFDYKEVPSASAPAPRAEITDDQWRQALRNYEQMSHWNAAHYGPEPGKPGCRVPNRLLQSQFL